MNFKKPNDTIHKNAHWHIFRMYEGRKLLNTVLFLCREDSMCEWFSVNVYRPG